MNKSATLSADRRYRYELWRYWGNDSSVAMFIGLNPSTADETEDDPTIRRCIQFAKDWGYSGLCMTNLFAYRATQPADMMRADDPVGPVNDAHIMMCATVARVVIAAWGTGGGYLNRDQRLRRLIPNLHALRVTKDGHPAHPLYLPKSLTPLPYRYKS